MRPLWWSAPLIVLGCAAYLFFAPRYIDLDIVVQRHQGGGEFWWEQHRIELAYADSGGVLFVQRQVGTAYPDTHGWKTTADVFAFFDKQMRARGWEVTEGATDDPAAPETRLLPKQNFHRYYRPHDRHPARYAILAVWRIDSDVVEGFHVALTTANPSLLMRISRGLD